jgi:hypothetical protein
MAIALVALGNRKKSLLNHSAGAMGTVQVSNELAARIAAEAARQEVLPRRECGATQFLLG